ncbi:MAG: hypothetical protein EXS36_20000 [Pedosphaera sp.]|nr:hypothetical protein [Pedosphaera sp.]
MRTNHTANQLSSLLPFHPESVRRMVQREKLPALGLRRILRIPVAGAMVLTTVIRQPVRLVAWGRSPSDTVFS